ncbi:MAG: hypothetical protein R3321_02920 [Nitrososphaeraceae archaeon]|nr:hypothetical protein [Nitrososphaeraceae archaeon]
MDLTDQKSIDKLKPIKRKNNDGSIEWEHTELYTNTVRDRTGRSRLDIDIHPELKELFIEAVIEKYGLDQYCSRREIGSFLAIETRNLIKEFIKGYGKKSKSLRK